MHKTFSRVAHLFQTDASGCRRLEIKSKLIGKSSRVHRVDRYPDGNLCENILACLACVVDNLAPALCVMPLSMYWLWSRLTTLHWSRKLVSKLRKQNYQVKAKTRPWQRRHPVASVIALVVQLAVEREAVAI